MYVCVSVHTHFSRITRPSFTKYSSRVSYGRVSVLVWRALRYIRYVLPVVWMTSYFPTMGAWQHGLPLQRRRCNIDRGLTPLLFDTGSVLSYRRLRMPRIGSPSLNGCRGRNLRRTVTLLELRSKLPRD